MSFFVIASRSEAISRCHSRAHYIIPAEAGIQRFNNWIPNQVGNDAKRGNGLDKVA